MFACAKRRSSPNDVGVRAGRRVAHTTRRKLEEEKNDDNEKVDETTINKETMADEEAKDHGGGAAGADDRSLADEECLVDAADCRRGDF